jgi:hypothetical protein
MSRPPDSAEPPATDGAVGFRAPRKVVIVTGASQGIGAGVAEGFRQAGYAVWPRRAR